MAIVLRCSNPVEYIQKIIISFFIVPLDEMIYWARQRSVQNPEPAICRCSSRFLLNSQKRHLCRSLFFNKVESELWQYFMSNFFVHLQTTASENVKLFILTFFRSKFKIKVINYFFKLKLHKMSKTTQILGNSFFLKKLRICFWKNNRLLNRND